MKIQRIEFHRQQKVYEWILTNELVGGKWENPMNSWGLSGV